MSTILTYIAINDGKIKRSSLEVLSRATELAKSHNLTSAALVVDANASSYTDQISKYGPSVIYTIENPVFKNPLNGPLLKALASAMNEVKPRVVAFASTEGSKDILGALAANQNAASLPDVSSFDLTADSVTAKRPVMAAKMVAGVEAKGEPVLVSVRSGSYDAVENPGNAEVKSIDYDINDGDINATLREIISAAGDKVDLSEAEAIVAAGRGVKDEAGRQLISDLSDILNASIGASRALTEAGVYDPSLQIGQTGKVVSPQLYIAVGISGAIQHVAGMTNSKVIVAINKDPDAPIFEVADYGIVGDLYAILPPFIEEIKKIKSQN
jgi:electron transfer flavoprotein alpha subunit